MKPDDGVRRGLAEDDAIFKHSFFAKFQNFFTGFMTECDEE